MLFCSCHNECRHIILFIVLFYSRYNAQIFIYDARTCTRWYEDVVEFICGFIDIGKKMEIKYFF